jgi:hypothetical protein
MRADKISLIKAIDFASISLFIDSKSLKSGFSIKILSTIEKPSVIESGI